MENPFALPPQEPPKRKPLFTFVRKERPKHNLEHIVTTKEVRDYLKSLPQDHPIGTLSRDVLRTTTRQELCETDFRCNNDLAEPVLLDDLERAKQNHTSAETLRTLRGMIRATSWMAHPRVDRELLLKEAQDRLRSVESEQNELRRTSQEDDARDLEEEKRNVQTVLDAIRERTTGEELLPALVAVEHLVWKAWRERQAAETVTGTSRTSHPHIKNAKERLAIWQRLRDALYFAELYPNWMEQAEGPSRNSI